MVAGSGADKFMVVLETVGLNVTELSAYCRERGLYPEQVERWRQAAQDANEKQVLTLQEQLGLEKLRTQDQREIKALRRELQRREKATPEMAACWCCEKCGSPSARRTRNDDERRSSLQGDRADQRGPCRGGRAWSAPAARSASACARSTAGERNSSLSFTPVRRGGMPADHAHLQTTAVRLTAITEDHASPC